MYMDFDQHHMESHGHGQFERMGPGLLPPLHLMYCANPSDSGKVHSSVKQRWLQGDEEVRAAMREVAECAVKGRWVWVGWEGRRTRDRLQSEI